MRLSATGWRVAAVAAVALAAGCSDDAGVSDGASDVSRDTSEVGDGGADGGGDGAGEVGDTAVADGSDAQDSAADGPIDPPVGVSIVFDYRFDGAGFFASAESRAVLDEAARQWGLVLRDDFDEIPAGTQIYVRNPQDTSQDAYITLDSPIDDLLVFPGAAVRGTSAAGASATALFPAESSDPELRAALTERWEGDDFEPWTGWVQFNSERTWFFDTTFATGDDIPQGNTDALSTALHELGHILGIAPGGAFERLVVDDHFVGEQAMAVYGGPVPLADGFGHVAEDVTVDGMTPIMATGRIRGQRYQITRLDIAMLADVGYETD